MEFNHKPMRGSGLTQIHSNPRLQTTTAWVLRISRYGTQNCLSLRYSELSLTTVLRTISHYGTQNCLSLRYSELSLTTVLRTISHYGTQNYLSLRYSELSLTTVLKTVSHYGTHVLKSTVELLSQCETS